MCSQCSRNKCIPKRFSDANAMIPAPLPIELQGLTQTEKMLIARALPIMRIYLKTGGQRGYSGHCINLPQNLNELASVLPRCPKDLIVVVHVCLTIVCALTENHYIESRSNPVEALIFFRLLLSSCLNWKIHCEDHSSLSSMTAVQNI